MKKLNRSILRKINYCIGLIFSLFGITSCEEISDKYGVPLADYQISGRVENAQKQGIKDIKVYMKRKAKADFEKLCQMMTEGKAFRRKGEDFRKLCSVFSTGRVTMENMLYDCVGMSGDDVLAGLRRKKSRISY
jgi:hypothetical protein